jgi:hypothetical protein
MQASVPSIDRSEFRSRTADRLSVLLSAVLLFALYLALRIPNLRGFAAFCDEATYLNWARLIRNSPIEHAFVSMQDNKLPLHYWILALAWHLDKDPILTGRMLSVILGALTLIPAARLCRELSTLADSPALFRLTFLLLMITCPLVAFNQRFALAEPLLLLECVTFAWLSLRSARHIVETATRSVVVLDGILIGILWAAVLLTKQNFSYALLALYPAAMLARIDFSAWFKQLKTFVIPFSICITLGLAAFVPVLLFTSTPYSFSAKLFYKGAFLRDMDDRGRMSIVLDNILMLFRPRSGGHWQWWPYDLSRPLDNGWLYLYLTPPILLLSLVGVVWFICRGLWRPLIFLSIWTFAFLISLLFANIMFSRYMLVGCIPLLLIVAWFAADLLEHLRAKLGRAWRAVAAIALATLLAWPTIASMATLVDYRAPTLARRDRFQHLSGAPSGIAAELLVKRLAAFSETGPITVVTSGGLSIHNEYVWLMLKDSPNVQLLRDDTVPPLRTDGLARNMYFASVEQWPPNPLIPVEIPPGQPVYYISAGQLANGELGVVPSASQIGLGAQTVEIFHNPVDIPGEPATYEIQIIRLFNLAQ